MTTSSRDERHQPAQPAILAAGTQPEELASLMRQEGLRYVYIGAKGGSLSARAMVESGLFQTLYQANGTWAAPINPLGRAFSC